jgi:hypothetical protein
VQIFYDRRHHRIELFEFLLSDRKGELQRMKTPGGWSAPAAGRQNPGCTAKALEHPEYDGADKGDRQIRGHYAQAADERT